MQHRDGKGIGTWHTRWLSVPCRHQHHHCTNEQQHDSTHAALHHDDSTSSSTPTQATEQHNDQQRRAAIAAVSQQRATQRQQRAARRRPRRIYHGTTWRIRRQRQAVSIRNHVPGRGHRTGVDDEPQERPLPTAAVLGAQNGSEWKHRRCSANRLHITRRVESRTEREDFAP